jgi:hypothetical protein
VAAVVTVLVVRPLERTSNNDKVQTLTRRIEALETRPAPPIPEPMPNPAPMSNPAPLAPPEVYPADLQPCDEVACVLDNYQAHCCARFNHSIRDNLDRVMISDGMRLIKAKVAACGDRSTAKGTVKVSVRVAPDGSVSSVTVKASPEPALGTCVSAAIALAKFAETRYGGSFSYPFVF